MKQHAGVIASVIAIGSAVAPLAWADGGEASQMSKSSDEVKLAKRMGEQTPQAGNGPMSNDQDGPSPEILTMALPREEVASGFPPLPPPDLKILATRVLPPPVFESTNPSDVLDGFDKVGFEMPTPNGFNRKEGASVEVMGGSHGRVQTQLQGSRKINDNLSVYGAVSTLRDKGWQDHSLTKSIQSYGDIGWRKNGNELHLKVQTSNNTNNGLGFAPLELIANDPSRTVSYDSGFKTSQRRLDLTLDSDLGAGWRTNGDFSYAKTSLDTQFTINSPMVPIGCGATPPFFDNGDGMLCFEGNANYPLTNSDGNQYPDAISGSGYTNYTIISRTWTDTTSARLRGNIKNNGQLFGRDNKFAAGFGLASGDTDAKYTSTLGYLTSDGGVGQVLGDINVPGKIVPQAGNAKTMYGTLYATDILDVTDQLRIGATGRIQYARIKQRDLQGNSAELNASKSFHSFAPSLGASYKLANNLLAYGGYHQSTRVLTPAGVLCDDGESNCGQAAPWLAVNGILDQSVSRTLKLGLRGQLLGAGDSMSAVRVAWNANVFSSNTSDDNYMYVNVGTGRAALQNIGDTKRKGIKLGLATEIGSLSLSTNYTYEDARFKSNFDFYSPLNPLAVNNYISVRNGNVIPNSPKHTLRMAANYRVNGAWSVGTTLRIRSSAHYAGDENNVREKIPGYSVWSFNTRYRMTEKLELFAILENAFNKQYGVAGALLPTREILNAIGVSNTGDERSLVLGQPRSLYVGMKYMF